MNMIILHSQQMFSQQYEHGYTTFTTNVGVLTIWTHGHTTLTTNVVLTIWTCSCYSHNKCCCDNNMTMFILHSQQMILC